MTGVLGEGERFGGFEIERELGRGGMGVVYLAEQVNLRRKVALKVIAPQLSGDADFRARFEREARLAASLDHPNVVPVFETGSVDSLLYLAMRYVRGTDLGEVLTAEGLLDPERAGHIVCQLGAALDAAHANGLIHRDVKPGNVLLADADPNGHVYLTDFGLTKEASGGQSAQLTNTGQWVGTVDYVAPEQLDGRPIDARTDVYSLGCVLYQLLSGRIPYEGTSVQKMFSHSASPPPSLESVDTQLATQFDAVIARAMAKDPSDRYPSAGDLGRAALASARGTTVRMPEGSVAAGAAAEGSADSLIATQIGSGHPGAYTRAEDLSERARHAAAPRLGAPPAPATTAGRVPSGERRRSRLFIPTAGIAAVLLAAGAGAFLIARGNGGDQSSPARAKAKVRPEQPSRKPEAARPQSASPDVTREPAPASPPTEVSFTQYAAPSSGFSTQVPTGSEWTRPVETKPNAARYRTTMSGPGGLVVHIDYTLYEPPKPPPNSRLEEQGIPTKGFGTATKYTFSGGDDPQCAESQCIDYIVGSGRGGYAILVGPDSPLARRVAEKITASMAYYDL